MDDAPNKANSGSLAFPWLSSFQQRWTGRVLFYFHGYATVLGRNEAEDSLDTHELRGLEGVKDRPIPHFEVRLLNLSSSFSFSSMHTTALFLTTDTPPHFKVSPKIEYYIQYHTLYHLTIRPLHQTSYQLATIFFI
jgi:hypothetical protein